ncbi:MAG: hypothetical protein IJH12_06050 [Clostridia bacterium]|nr:hypothetical protein [Clostridia bacterium]
MEWNPSKICELAKNLNRIGNGCCNAVIEMYNTVRALAVKRILERQTIQ